MRKLKTLVKLLKASKDIIAKERDKLREIYEEIESLVNDLDEGLVEIESGIDTISKKL